MAKITISHEMASKYPEFKGRFGETIDVAELRRAESDFAQSEEGRAERVARSGEEADVDTDTDEDEEEGAEKKAAKPSAPAAPAKATPVRTGKPAAAKSGKRS